MVEGFASARMQAPNQAAVDFETFHNGNILINEKRVPVLQVFLEHEQDIVESELLSFSWECVGYADDELAFVLNFDQPLQVSASAVPDQLVIRFNDQRLF